MVTWVFCRRERFFFLSLLIRWDFKQLVQLDVLVYQNMVKTPLKVYRVVSPGWITLFSGFSCVIVVVTTLKLHQFLLLKESFCFGILNHLFFGVRITKIRLLTEYAFIVKQVHGCRIRHWVEVTTKDGWRIRGNCWRPLQIVQCLGMFNVIISWVPMQVAIAYNELLPWSYVLKLHQLSMIIFFIVLVLVYLPKVVKVNLLFWQKFHYIRVPSYSNTIFFVFSISMSYTQECITNLF
jgi:hypothetical protein